MPRYLLDHRHSPQECVVVFASWRGVDSPLRNQPTAASCRFGGHAIWWQVEAATPEQALGMLPEYIASRTSLTEVEEVQIP